MESDLKIQGPVEIEMKVYITDGKRSGAATIGMGLGSYGLDEQRMRDRVQQFVDEEMPAGFRLMNKREFFDHAVLPPQRVEDEEGEVRVQRFAMPGGDEFDA